MTANRNKFIPNKQDNPMVIAARLKKTAEQLDAALLNIEQNKKIWEMEKAGIKNHFSKITNFTSHDLKNAIQNMDATISTLDIENVTMEQLYSIKSCLNSMRMSLDDFYSLSFEGRKIRFTLEKLADLVELLNKSSIQEYKIKFENILHDEEVEIHNSFHSMIQVLNNLIINSITAFPLESNNRKLRIEYSILNESVIVEVSDNAFFIPIEMREKIFDLYFSTTGGSGIGLAHARFLLEKMNGSIDLIADNELYCTRFLIKFPLNHND